MKGTPLFGHRIWMTSVGLYLSAASWLVGIWLIASGKATPFWLALTFLMHFVYAVFISVGHHRYFCHRTFETNRFWQIVLLVGTILVMYGSPIQWAAVHTAHHKYSDGPRDPHVRSWRYILAQFHKEIPYVMGSVKRLISDPLHRIAHRYFVIIYLLIVIPVAILFPKIALYGYLMPIFTVSVVGITHQTISHWNNQPRNRPILEFLLPAVGEWYHRTHHRYPGLKRLGTFDIGFLVIKLIESKRA